MRAPPAHIQNVIASDALTLATCWRITLQSGTVLRFTDYHDNIVIGAETFIAEGGFTRSAIGFGLGLAEDSLEATGTLGSDSITETDLEAGKYDYAAIEIFVVDYLAPNSGVYELCAGELGEIEMADSEFRAQMYGTASLFQQAEVELCSPTCRANLGDERCQKDLTAHRWTGTVTAALSTVLINTNVVLPAGVLAGGTIEFHTGANADLLVETKANNTALGTGVIELFLPVPYAAAVGDTFTVTRGCNKTLEHCVIVFNNVLNFRGEPFTPGSDRILQVNNAKPSEAV